VLPEHHSLFTTPVGLQRGQRLQVNAALAGIRIEGSNRATRARLDHLEFDLANANTPPAIFGIGQAAVDNQVRPETTHPQRAAHARRQVLERGLTNQQYGKTIGEGHAPTVAGIAPVYVPCTVRRYV